jgi:S-formylglutathione hydrolase
MAVALKLLIEQACFGGALRFYEHDSQQIGLPMRFAVYLPPQALAGEACPAIVYLAGLTCNEETFMVKAGAQRVAAREGLILIAPDTSPRGANLPGDSDSWDFGVAAGFYLDATEQPWARHYRMYSYVVHELHAAILTNLPIAPARVGIMGHSMGGHGALTLALRNPQQYRSVSAFAPIAAPMRCPWGQKAFSAYLGANKESWKQYDASALMTATGRACFAGGILIDQGLSDKFLVTQLYPEAFEEACREAGQPLTLRRHAGYDHLYYFIASFIEDHLMHHKNCLSAIE